MSRLRLLITLPLLAIVILFAVVNRNAVAVNFWPLPWVANLPLYAVAFGAFFLGVLAGGIAVWVGGMRKRRRVRQKEAARQAPTGDAGDGAPVRDPVQTSAPRYP
ncbi:MAG: DUF1049 domain-containing protein [Alphaproteobacteria bacterium]|nr:DUF1049 domain-containing protein [Alphaproteobacteria bacterium]